VGVRGAILESTRRNAESVVAMGMGGAMAGRWGMANTRYLDASGRSSDVVTSYGSASKIVRLLLQSIILGLGAYLVIRMEMTAGAMIAASIMMGRALAPIETAIANWRSFISARQSIRRLSAVLAQEPRRADAATELPAPVRSLDVEQISVAAPGVETPIVRDVRFQLTAGEALGIIGPNGAGKTSLVRTLVGIWPPLRGMVRLDGAALDQWDADALGQHIGFVAQSVDLFDGTVAENISRMAQAPDSEAVLRAARAAAAHEMILRLPQGYDTRIGEAGAALSAGQRQRIGLARALYGDPFLVVLDEPHANLDNEGEAALTQTIMEIKARRAIVVIIANRPSALTACDKVLFLANGVQQALGPRDEVLAKLMRPPAPAATGGLKIVSDSAGGGGA
jgi:PrtD family type I secretion system ABC transporter